MLSFFGGGKKDAPAAKDPQGQQPQRHVVAEKKITNDGAPSARENTAAADRLPVVTQQGAPDAGDGASSSSSAVSSSDHLLISNKRLRSYYERATRELFASGHKTVTLSALGDAIPLAVHLAISLEAKRAVTIAKVDTKEVVIPRDPQDTRHTVAPGITIALSRHADFRGSRIVPGFVFFSPSESSEAAIQGFPHETDRVYGTTNIGYADVALRTETGTEQALLDVLKAAGQSVDQYAHLHNYLLTEALEQNKDEHEMRGIKLVGELSALKDYHPNLKAAFCRVCPELKEQAARSGTVFIDMFEDDCLPHGHHNNACLLHVVAPRGADFADADKFLDAVRLTATNLMTALCDLNGYAKRSADEHRFKRLGVVKIPLFSAEANVIHKGTTAEAVAHAILKGLDSGYHFGPAPRICLGYSEGDLFRKVWTQEFGNIDEAGLLPAQITDSKFRRPPQTRGDKAAARDDVEEDTSPPLS